jgi:uncharacterized protein YecE (DUF72 family)
MVKTLERWREEMPADFEFTLKAWQLITHSSSSPTFKRLRRKLSETEMQDAGSFRLTPIVREAWDVTLASAHALRGAYCGFFNVRRGLNRPGQTLGTWRGFFSEVDRKGLNFAWEPRGAAWSVETVRRICNGLDLWHAVDPFANAIATPDRCYFRLHGRVRWRYQYEDGELEELASMMPKKGLSYVFFNNITMTRDAETFKSLLGNRLK